MNVAVQTSVVVSDQGVAARLERAVTRGLIAAATVMVLAVKEKLNRPGESPPRKKGTKSAGKLSPVRARIQRGERILGKAGSLIGGAFLDRLSASAKASVRTALRFRDLPTHRGRLVDPPGGSPRVRTGTLRRSIGMEMPSNDVVRIGSDVEYAAIHEYGGTVHVAPFGKGAKRPIIIPARPYFRPAAEASKIKAAAEFAREFEEAMR